MNYVALSFLAIFSLPFVFLVGLLIYRRFFAVPLLPVGIRLIPLGWRWTFADGQYISQFIFWTKRSAAMHAIAYRQTLSRL